MAILARYSVCDAFPPANDWRASFAPRPVRASSGSSRPLTPPGESELRLTPEVLRLWDQRARKEGRPENWRLPDDQREASRRAVLGDRHTARDLWVYAYGPLMWDPGIHFSEVRLAHLDGYQRRFTYRITAGRGTPECPALMLSLERRAGCCRGLAFLVSPRARRTWGPRSSGGARCCAVVNAR